MIAGAFFYVGESVRSSVREGTFCGGEEFEPAAGCVVVRVCEREFQHSVHDFDIF